MSYIGSTPTTQSFIAGTDYFNGTGSQTAFTLSRSVVSVNDIEVVINNVEQQPNTAYTVSGTTITFTSAPSAGTANIYVRYLSTTTQSITPSQNTVSYSTLNSDTQSKLGISFKNRLINPAMVIDQRNAGASITPTSVVAGTYSVDRWQTYCSQASKYSVQQNAGSVTPPVGFANYLGFTSLSAYSIGAGETCNLRQIIEGYNIADLNFGSANAKTVTISFWVRSSLTGTFGGYICNGAGDRSYVYSYTISSANTWEQKTVTIAGDTSGTWTTTNGQGMYVGFALAQGSSTQGAAGVWTAGSYFGVTGQTNVLGTNGATFYITGVQLEVGTQATTFDYRSYGTELSLCQRYYYQNTSGLGEIIVGGYTGGSFPAWTTLNNVTTMRATPTGTIIGSWALSNVSSFSVAATSQYGMRLSAVSTGSGSFYSYNANAGSGYSLSAEL